MPDPAPGQVWRSKGKAGHAPYSVTIIKRTAGGKVVIDSATSPHRRSRNRLHTMTVAAFLNNYEYEGSPA